jgi:molecular chaperone HtpG
MDVELQTNAEQEAQKAEDLPAFGGIKLLYIKRQLAHLLSLIGRNGIFDEYTRHDVSHVDKMLTLLDWLIPEGTKSAMSPADWLLTVLSIYFHDVGMLVTNKEYENRYSSSFADFCNSVLSADADDSDYRYKVEALPPEKRQRFLYQEFVRHHHAERIRWWVTGVARDHLGVATDAIGEIDKLLLAVDQQFRRDLGFVCESHHLDDLNDLKKYRVSQPYGDSDEETANLQYAAMLLRAADLLHITKKW